MSTLDLHVRGARLRPLLLKSALAALAFGWAGACLAAAPEAPATELQQLAPGVYYREGKVEDWGAANQGRVSNQGVIVGERCVAVVDTSGTPADGRQLRVAIAKLTPLPVCYVINTHAHPDHVLGNEAFAGAAGGDARFVGHARLPAALQSRGPYYLNALKRDFGPEHADARLVAPSVTVDDSIELDLGNRKLRVKAWKTAHTDSDLTVLDEKSRVMFLGDLLFIDHVPVVDGSLKGWLAALQTLAASTPAIAVPGHGAATSDFLSALERQKAYLEALRRDTLAAIKSSVTLARAVEQIRPDRPQWKLLDTFHKRNVTAAYAELEWEE